MNDAAIKFIEDNNLNIPNVSMYSSPVAALEDRITCGVWNEDSCGPENKKWYNLWFKWKKIKDGL